MSLVELFCDVDDFCQELDMLLFAGSQIGRKESRGGKPRMSMSEMMTIAIYFHMEGYRNFKTFYISKVRGSLSSEFPRTLSYNRFVELQPRLLVPLCLYLRSRFGQCTGISFIDATPLAVCHNKRISRHKVFDGVAARGKTSMGWFYGFKLHLIINELGEILAFCVTPGNVDDRKPVPKLADGLFGKLFGDKGYIKKALFKKLFEDGLSLFTPLRKDMHNKLMTLQDKLLLRKRSIIETVNDQLKNISQIEHSRHRSVFNFGVNLIAGLVAYTHQEKKPMLHLSDDESASVPALI